MQTISKRITLIFTLIALLLMTNGCQNDHNDSPPLASADRVSTLPLRTESLAPLSRHELHSFFLQHEYSWNTVDHGVPPLIVEKFPDDFYELAAGSERSRTFFLTLLPMVLLVNDEIRSERNQLLELFGRLDRNEVLNVDEIETIVSAAHTYKIERNLLIDRQARLLLLNRLDVIPASIALAQAASESAYGTSRFARLGNNLFGEMVFTNNSAGILPLQRPAGQKHKARIFPSLLDSLRAYMVNLNTHPAYGEFRQLRAAMRNQGEQVLGYELLQGLRSYSVRSDAYVDDLRAIMQANNLTRFTFNAQLRKTDQSLTNSPIRANQSRNRPTHLNRPIKLVIPQSYDLLLSQN